MPTIAYPREEHDVLFVGVPSSLTRFEFKVVNSPYHVYSIAEMEEHMSRWMWLNTLLISACGGGAGFADIEVGSIEGTPFEDVKAVYQGNSHIVFFDRDIDCLETAWISPNYIDGEDPTGGDYSFVALQFTFDASRPSNGTFSVAPDAPVKGYGLVNDAQYNEGSFTYFRGRDGFMTIDSVNEKVVEGSFDIQFASDRVSGSFEAAYCRNLR